MSAIPSQDPGYHGGVAGGHSERHLWTLGTFCFGARIAAVYRAIVAEEPWLDWIVLRSATGRRHARGGNYPRHYGPSHCRLRYARGHSCCAPATTRGSTGLGRYAL